MSAEPLGAPGPEAPVAVPRSGAHPDVYGRSRGALGDPSPLACTVAMAAMTIVDGGAGLDGIQRWLTPDVRELLARQHSLARRAGRAGSAPRVLRARTCRVSRDAAEVSVVAQVGGHAHAIAMRLEDWSGRWIVTVLEIG
ncbi:Rv3235 family protein [Demequina pelophila]|uniref:Rv3235 family protein n=1 Tax=Demequina pelophila TaxID=1638984 RepID=UPI000783BD01|nr:Rv3235 family protein [Demequina pelophila]